MLVIEPVSLYVVDVPNHAKCIRSGLFAAEMKVNTEVLILKNI